MQRGRVELRHAWENAPTHRSIAKLERLAYERHAKDLRTGADRGLWFDDNAALRAIRIIETTCRHWKGEWAGQLVKLENWQKFVVGSLFGWKRADGSRRFRIVYQQMARKNGKTFLLAAIGLLLLIADKEPGAEIFCAATKRAQAKRLFDDAAAMVRNSDELSSFCTVHGGHRNSKTDNIFVDRLGAFMEPLTADSETEDGLNVHGGLVDELHAHKDGGMWDALETGTGARRQPVMAAITTPGAGQDSVCWEQRYYGAQVLEGLIEDDAFLAFICEPDAEEDWTLEATWEQGCPNIDVSVKREQLREACKRAQSSTSRQNDFRRKRIGQWTEQIARWLPMAAWKKCDGIFDPAMLEGRPCYAGLDLAAIHDLTAFVLVFPPIDERPFWYSLTWCWIPEDSLLERKRVETEMFRPWIARGFLETTPGDTTDYVIVRERILEASELYDIQQIGVDPWNATQLTNQLIEQDGFVVVKVSQSIAGMTGPSKEFEKLVRNGNLRHGNHPVARWAAGSVAIWTDPNENIKPSRKSSGGRIDPIIAHVMAVGLAAVGDEFGSVYDKRGIETA